MKKIYYLPFFATITVLAACNEHYYSPALYKNDMVYQFKPMSSDTAKDATYISGGINLGGGSTQSDNVLMGELHLDRANTFENLNLTYGAYAVAGSYQNSSIQAGDPQYFDSKFMGAYGFTGAANIFVASGRADYRILGLAASYSNEFGDYADFRKKAQSAQGFYTDASTSVFTAGFTNETIWKSHSFEQGYRVFLGEVFGNHNYVNTSTPTGTTTGSNYNTFNNNGRVYLSGTYFLQVNKYHIAVDVQNFTAVNIQFGYRF